MQLINKAICASFVLTAVVVGKSYAACPNSILRGDIRNVPVLNNLMLNKQINNTGSINLNGTFYNIKEASFDPSNTDDNLETTLGESMQANSIQFLAFSSESDKECTYKRTWNNGGSSLELKAVIVLRK